MKNLNFEKLNTYNIQNLGQDQNRLSKETCEKIILELELNHFQGTEDEIIYYLIAGFLQKGGTNRNATIEFKTVIDEVEYTINTKMLQTAINSVNKRATLRQFARGIADEIAEVSVMYNIPGDLASQMKLNHPEITEEEAAWCSNFQTHNPNCPPYVREWLVENYNNRFKR